jgi:peptidyl-prolyl cis-trans isomerase SurA
MTSTKTLAAAVLVACGAFVAAPRAEIIEQILVKVNGEIFTKTDLEARQVATLRQMGQQIDPKTKMTDAQLRKMMNESTPQLLVSVVDEILMVQRGKELGYKMSDEQFQSVLGTIKKDNKIESDEQFQEALKQEHMTLPELRKNLERQMLISRVQQAEVLGKIAVSEDEARRYYDAHLTEFTTSPAVTLREILVAVPVVGGQVNVAQDDAAKERATQIRQRALAGESFEKLAADLSTAPSRANAGLIGPLNVRDIAPDVRKLVESMKVGDISSVIRAPGGYQLLKLETQTQAQTTPFEQAREDISNRVFTDKRKDEFEKYLTKLRTQAIIEWKNADVKKAYDQGLEQAKTGAAPRAQD